MTKFEGSTEQEAVKKACEALGVEDPSTLKYQVIGVKKSVFSTTVTIGIFSIKDVIVFADDYIKKCLKALGCEGFTEAKYEDEVIKLNIVSSKNKTIIGKNGATLRSINELTRSACFNRFGGHYKILLNCDGYKELKYNKYVSLARRAANEVRNSHVAVVLDPMTSDERRIVHQVLSTYTDLKSESSGSGHERHITIQYVGSNQKGEVEPKESEE